MNFEKEENVEMFNDDVKLELNDIVATEEKFDLEDTMELVIGSEQYEE